VRAIFPAFAYQLGNLFAAYLVTIEALVAQSLGSITISNYSLALALFSAGAFIVVALLTAVGREAKGIGFLKVTGEELVR